MSDSIKFGGVTLDCPDAGELAAFYAEITGGEVTVPGASWAMMTCPDGSAIWTRPRCGCWPPAPQSTTSSRMTTAASTPTRSATHSACPPSRSSRSKPDPPQHGSQCWPPPVPRRGCDAQGRVPKIISAERLETIFGCADGSPHSCKRRPVSSRTDLLVFSEPAFTRSRGGLARSVHAAEMLSPRHPMMPRRPLLPGAPAGGGIRRRTLLRAIRHECARQRP